MMKEWANFFLGLINSGKTQMKRLQGGGMTIWLHKHVVVAYRGDGVELHSWAC